MVGCCEHGYEHLDVIQCWKFLDFFCRRTVLLDVVFSVCVF